MSIIVSKTDYLIYRDCPKNAWMKIHRPDIYKASELSSFEKLIIETGNEVEAEARKLYPTGVLISGRDEAAEAETEKLLGRGESVIFQPLFKKDNFLAAVDILRFDAATGEYTICEVKASSGIDKNVHLYDLAFQVNLLRMCGLRVTTMELLHLNSKYVRQGEVDITKLFVTPDLATVTTEVEALLEEVALEMEVALAYLNKKDEPADDKCKCIYKGRSNHCTTFAHNNKAKNIPAYGVHDISRIGLSKAKLKELVDEDIFNLHDVPTHLKLTDVQQNQIDAYKYDKVTISPEGVRGELEQLVYPLYFLDYETFPSAIPRFDGYTPYQQIPFQYSLHILRARDAELEHREFLYTEKGDPAPELANALQNDIGPTGSVIVWNKMFERGRNTEMGRMIPEVAAFMESVNSRLYDLQDVFSKQHYVHKEFKGKTSIKKILPVLAPTLSYKVLDIQEGGTASESWNKIATGEITGDAKKKVEEDLKKYCGLDSQAMYEIWRVLDAL